MCARAVGREVGLTKAGAQVQKTVERVVLGAGGVGQVGLLRGITRKSLGQVLKYRDEESKEAFVRKAVEHAVSRGVLRRQIGSLGSEAQISVVFLVQTGCSPECSEGAGEPGTRPSGLPTIIVRIFLLMNSPGSQLRLVTRLNRINKTTSIPHAGRAGDKPVLNMQVTGLGLARGLLGRGGRRKEKKEGKGLLPL